MSDRRGLSLVSDRAPDDALIPRNEAKAAVMLAIHVIAFSDAFAVYFPAPAKDLAEMATRTLADEGIEYWIAPGGTSITCVKCRLSSSNPHDVANRYCGACHEFHKRGVA